ncbi:MAG: heme ABC transporter ATP-binding protein [Actinomycetota bacterium]
MGLRSKQVALPARQLGGGVLCEARQVRATLGGKQVLSCADLTVLSGEIVALVGPNGAGKSTLLAVIAGDLKPDHGEVFIHGARIGQWSAFELSMRRAVLPQHVTVTFPFTVREIVSMGRAPWGRTCAQEHDDEQIEQALAATELSDLRDRHFPSLSGGERARASLARTLVQQTQLLLLDEPTASMDVRHQELVLGQARRRARMGDGILVVVHDLGLAAAHADRAVIMKEGKVVASGPPSQVFTPSILSQVYEHEIEVFLHPATGVPIILPTRLGRAALAPTTSRSDLCD